MKNSANNFNELKELNRFKIIAYMMVIGLILISSMAKAQKRMNHWYFGTNISFEWNCSNDYVFSSDVNPVNSFSTPCSVSNEEGDFMFNVNATDWESVGQETVGGIYDRTGSIMALSGGGVADLYDNVSGSSGVAVGFQVSENIWYTIYNYSLNVQNGDYFYSIIDMSLPGNGTIANPAGEVIEHRTFLTASSKFDFTAARHDNGTDYWVTIAQTNEMQAYQISASGISAPVITPMSVIPTGNNIYKVSQMAFSPDGSKLAYQWGVMDFDIATGNFSNLQHLPSGSMNCFSANCKYLYRGKKAWPSNENYIIRYETAGLNSASLPLDTIGFHGPASDVTAYAPDWGTSSILHSNGDIYFKNGVYGDMSIIRNPDSATPTIEINEIMFDGAGSWWSTVDTPGSWGFGHLPRFVTSWAVEVTAETIMEDEIFTSCDSTVFEFSGTNCGMVTTEEWNFGDGSTATESNPTHAYLFSGTYEVEYIVRNDSTCSQWNTDTLRTTIVVENAGELEPTIIDSTLSLCFNGAPFDLTASPNVGSWSGVGIIEGTTGLFDPSISGPGLFEIVFETTGNCAGDDTISVIVDPAEDAAFTYSELIYCPYDGLQNPIITGLAGGLFSCHDGGLVLDIISGEVDLANSLPGIYEVFYTTTGVCPGVSNRILKIEELPNVNPSDLTNCEGETYSVEFFGTGSDYNWTNLTGIDIGFGLAGVGDIPDYIAELPTSLIAPIEIEVVPVTNIGCLGDPKLFSIDVNPTPTVLFEGNVLGGCAPLLVEFTSLSETGIDCIWDFGDGMSSVDCGPISHEFNTGDFDVSLTITTNEGCVKTAIYTDYISADPIPNADFIFSPTEITIENPSVNFTNYSENASTYSWDFGYGLGSSTDENPSYLFDYTPANYLVTLWAYNETGLCKDSITKEIQVLDALLYYIPNAFTPDGDQFNQVFQPVFNTRIDESSFHMLIFDRWGEVVFESYDASKGWNGTYGNGELVGDGIYIWQLIFKEDNTDKKHLLNGHVTVLK